MMKMPHPARCHNLFFLVISLLVAMRTVKAVASYLGPEALAASRDGKTLYIALADARQLALFDVAGGHIPRKSPCLPSRRDLPSRGRPAAVRDLPRHGARSP